MIRRSAAAYMHGFQRLMCFLSIYSIVEAYTFNFQVTSHSALDGITLTKYFSSITQSRELTPQSPS